VPFCSDRAMMLFASFTVRAADSMQSVTLWHSGSLPFQLTLSVPSNVSKLYTLGSIHDDDEMNGFATTTTSDSSLVAVGVTHSQLR
jgi:hypothetical protein